MNLVAIEAIPVSTGTIAAGQAFTAEPPLAAEFIVSGKARRNDGTTPAWTGIQWPGATVVILASGDSLTVEQCEAVRVWRAAATGRRAIAINTTFRRVPWADVLYACDAPWWRSEAGREARATFVGELWTQDPLAEREWEINLIPSHNGPGLSKRAGVIHQGGNGGYQAIGLAVQTGARRIVLLGYDMKGTHWHGRHPSGLSNTPDHLFKTWVQKFEPLAADLAVAGVEVVNATPGSALTCFSTANLEAVLS